MEGDVVKEGQTLLVMEAMKMETEIKAKVSGKIEQIFVKKGDQVKKGQSLLKM